MKILEKILRNKEREIERAKRRRPLRLLQRELKRSPIRRRLFKKALGSSSNSIAIIAEIKKKSPSGGLFKRKLRPVKLAKAFQDNGASALSVLTDRPFFGGKLEDLKSIREETSLPILRKDFIVDPYQVYESAWAGADAILLIAGILPVQTLKRLYRLARRLKLDVLAEVHSRKDLQKIRALKDALVGINNRDLKTFRVNLNTTRRLFPHIPRGRLIVSESGIRNPRDLLLLKKIGIHAALIGESLMSHGDPGDALKRLLESHP